MGDISDIVSHAPGAVFATGPGLKVVAWNRAAEEASGRSEASVLGKVCYEVVHAVDADTGRPCYEACPLVNPALRKGWVHSRVLQTRPPAGPPAYLDCMLLHYVLPSTQQGALSVLTPLTAEDAHNQLRATAALEALYPLMVGGSAPEQALPRIVRIVLDASGAETAEIVVLDPRTGRQEQGIRVSRGDESPHALEDAGHRAHLRSLETRADGALIALRHSAESSKADSPSWDLTAPILDGCKLLGAVTVTSQRSDFSIGHAARVLFAMTGQISVFLRWIAIADPSWRGSAEPQRATAAPELRLYCLGQFRVLRCRNGDEQEIPAAQFRRPQKSLTLLKILAAHRGRTLPREALIDYLWPDADPTLAANNLRVVLYELRHGLEPDLARGKASSFILSLGDQVYLDPSERCWVDVEEFERLARETEALAQRGQAEAAVATGRSAAALYRSEYLADEPYADWCIAERERLSELHVGLLQRLAQLEADGGDLDEGIAACRRALAVDPIREQTHRQLMSLLARAGRRDEAIRQYEVCRKLLWQELAVAPDESTQVVYRNLLAASSPALAHPHRPARSR